MKTKICKRCGYTRKDTLKEVFDRLEKLDGREVWTRDDILKILKKHFGVER